MGLVPAISWLQLRVGVSHRSRGSNTCGRTVDERGSVAAGAERTPLRGPHAVRVELKETNTVIKQ